VLGRDIDYVTEALPRNVHVGYIERRSVGRAIDRETKELAKLVVFTIGCRQDGFVRVQSGPEVVDVPRERSRIVLIYAVAFVAAIKSVKETVTVCVPAVAWWPCTARSGNVPVPALPPMTPSTAKRH